MIGSALHPSHLRSKHVRLNFDNMAAATLVQTFETTASGSAWMEQTSRTANAKTRSNYTRHFEELHQNTVDSLYRGHPCVHGILSTVDRVSTLSRVINIYELGYFTVLKVKGKGNLEKPVIER